MPPKAASFGVQKGSDGVIRQKFMQGSGWKPTELKRYLEQPTQLKAIKERYDIVIAEEVELHPCVLRCKGCSKLVSLTQPHQSTKQHNVACKSPLVDVEDMELADEGEGEETCACRWSTQRRWCTSGPTSSNSRRALQMPCNCIWTPCCECAVFAFLRPPPTRERLFTCCTARYALRMLCEVFKVVIGSV